MKIGALDLTLHRTVRVADGRTPSSLPPSLGHCKTYRVRDYRERCPADWADDALFVGLHESEALWLGFHSTKPLALLIGAGGVNAITGEKLGTKLETGNYIATPPQPWLDGWKSAGDGCVYQFVAQRYEGGKGNTVGEQLIGTESKTGAIGIAVFDPKDPLLHQKATPIEGIGTSAFDTDLKFKQSGLCSPTLDVCSLDSPRRGRASMRVTRMSEMGVGKGGKIRQKIYPDPYGLDAWNDSPAAVSAIYLVSAAELESITGDKIPAPATHDKYSGVWFGLKDDNEADVPGTDKFDGLKSAAFPGDTSNVDVDGKKSPGYNPQPE